MIPPVSSEQRRIAESLSYWGNVISSSSHMTDHIVQNTVQKQLRSWLEKKGYVIDAEVNALELLELEPDQNGEKNKNMAWAHWHGAVYCTQLSNTRKTSCVYLLYAKHVLTRLEIECIPYWLQQTKEFIARKRDIDMPDIPINECSNEIRVAVGGVDLCKKDMLFIVDRLNCLAVSCCSHDNSVCILSPFESDSSDCMNR